MRPDSTAKIVGSSNPTTASSFVKNRRSAGYLDCSKPSSATPTKRRAANAASPAKICFADSSRASITSSTASVWLHRCALRQLVNHGHFEVNGKAVNIPSYMLKPGDVVRVCETSRKLELIHESMRRLREGRTVPYLTLDKARMEGVYVALPKREEIPVTGREQLVVELYSR